MELMLTYTDTTFTPQGALSGCTLDVAYGSGENNFELVVPMDGDPLSAGVAIGIVGSAYGGVCDELATSTDEYTDTWRGRSFQGLLASKVLCPDTGADYLIVSGEANSVLLSLVSRVGLAGLLSVSTAASGITVSSYQFDRYVDAYTGICKMLDKSGARLAMEWDGRTVVLSAVATKTVSLDTNTSPLDMDKYYRPVNHLICAGKGELAARAIYHVYADADGNVSDTQTMTGTDEVVELYEDTNSEGSELHDGGVKKLKEYQGQSSADLSSLDTLGDVADIGDVFSAYDSRTDTTVTAQVTKKVVKLTAYGVTSCDYETGTTTSTKSSTSSESSGSGTVYTAGDGIKIVSGTISADVTQTKLDAVSATATQASTDASEAKATAGSAKATAEAAVQSVSATDPIAATTTSGAVSLSHAASGVSAGSYGATADATPAWGDSVNVGPQLSITAKGHITKATGRKVTIPNTVATVDADGLMDSADKQKLDGVEAGANAYTLPVAGAAIGGIKPDGVTCTVASDGTLACTGEAAAGFLAAHPVGSYFRTSVATNPGATYGGTWTQVSSDGPYIWHREA